jgi:hypothetical protein
MEKNYLLDMAFEVEADLDEDELLSKDFLEVLVNAALMRIANISKDENTEAFGVCDTYNVE